MCTIFSRDSLLLHSRIFQSKVIYECHLICFGFVPPIWIFSTSCFNFVIDELLVENLEETEASNVAMSANFIIEIWVVICYWFSRLMIWVLGVRVHQICVDEE